MRVLITGISGFAGSYLAEHLLACGGYEVWGTMRRGPGQAAHLAGRVQFASVDLVDPAQVEALLAQVKPDIIYHLAGQSFVAVSWREPWPTLETNIRGQLNILESVLRLKLATRVLAVGSNEEYGLVRPDELPLRETTPLRPDNPYGVSKVAQGMLAQQYFLSYGLPVVHVRPFNHIGPRQNERFVTQSFAKQIAMAEAGLQPPVISVGNLETARDFTDVRDTVRAYHLLMERGEPGEVYNVGSGRPHRIREMLDLLLSFSRVDIHIEPDPARLRPSDVPVAYADISKVRAATGWAPQIPFEQSLYDVLADWRATLQATPLGANDRADMPSADPQR